MILSKSTGAGRITISVSVLQVSSVKAFIMLVQDRNKRDLPLTIAAIMTAALNNILLKVKQYSPTSDSTFKLEDLPTFKLYERVTYFSLLETKLETIKDSGSNVPM